MENLAELAKIITRHGQKKIEIWHGISDKAGNDYAKTIDYLSHDGDCSEEAVANLLGMDKNSSRFHSFKHQLKEKMYTGLLSIDYEVNAASNYGRSMVECSRNEHGIRVLLHQSAINAAIDLARQTLKKATKFEFTDIALYCAQMLRRSNSIAGNKKEYQKYDKECEKYLAILQNEEISARCLEQLYVTNVNRNAYNAEDIKEAHELLTKLAAIAGELPNYRTGLNLYRVKGIVYLFERDFKAALANWDDYDRHIDRYKNFEFENRMGESAMQRLDIYLNMHDFENGKRCAGLCDTFFSHDSINWLFAKELFFLLAMHSKNYEEAGTTIFSVLEHPGYRNIGANKYEKWELYRGYFYLLIEVGKVPKEIRNNQKTEFRINKFMNESHVYSKDKRGYNTAILILQVLFLFAGQKFAKATGKIETLRRYNARHFNKGRFYRTSIFIKMICIAEKYNYNREETQKSTSALYNLLIDPANNYSSNQEGIEVIPYPELWEMIIGLM